MSNYIFFLTHLFTHMLTPPGWFVRIRRKRVKSSINFIGSSFRYSNINFFTTSYIHIKQFYLKKMLNNNRPLNAYRTFLYNDVDSNETFMLFFIIISCDLQYGITHITYNELEFFFFPIPIKFSAYADRCDTTRRDLKTNLIFWWHWLMCFVNSANVYTFKSWVVCYYKTQWHLRFINHTIFCLDSCVDSRNAYRRGRLDAFDSFVVSQWLIGYSCPFFIVIELVFFFLNFFREYFDLHKILV